MQKIQDTRVLSIDPLIAPQKLKDQLPVDEAIVATVVEARETIRRIIKGADHRMLCIVGPCSIHDPASALEFTERLRKLKDAVAEQLYIVMRVYFEKPRTTVGWKGLINDPHMDDSCDIPAGLRIARTLLVQINRMGLAAGTETLDPITPQYIADLIAWSAIGARTTESPNSSRDGERPLDAGRFQKFHRRQSPGRNQRDPVRAPAAFVPRHHAGWDERHRAHRRQS